MFQINRKIEYALIALRHISTSTQELIAAKEICDTYNTPFDTTSRVLQIMAQNGILRAEHGAHGGYQLIKDLTKITFHELAEMLVGPIQIASCFHGNYSQCDITAGCNVIAPMLNLNERMSELFKTINVQDLIESRHQGDRLIKEKFLERVRVAAK